MKSETWNGWTCEELTPNLCDLQVETGSLLVRGGIRLTYWRYHNEDAMKNDNDVNSLLPIVMLHGGPGFPHNYLLPLKQQACRGREVIFYDQAGCGASPCPPNTSAADFPWLLDPHYYAEEELPALLEHLKLDRFHILGHSSWGTIVAQLFALNTKSTKAASLVLSGPISDAQLCKQAQWNPHDENNLASLPPFVQERIHQLESMQQYDSAEYHAIDDILSSFFTLRTAPFPDCYMASEMGWNREVYSAIQGPSEFSITRGESFNITSRLKELDLPVLLTSGKFDSIRPPVVDIMHQEIRNSERVEYSNAAHVTHIDDPGSVNNVVADFLNRVEAGHFTPRPWTEANRKEDDSIPCYVDMAYRRASTQFMFVMSVFIAFALGAVFGSTRRRTNYESL